MTTSFPNSIKNLNETDYEDWKESHDLYLAIANLNLTMRTEKLGTITDASIEAQRILYEKWEHSNIVCLKSNLFKDDLDNEVSTPQLLTLEKDHTFLLIPIVPFPNGDVIPVIQNNDQVVVPQIDEHEQIDTLKPIGVAESSNIAEVVQLRRSQRP
ncbi:hypothetical protein KIW84_071496 [Lathyrus oleraceus]|uniref:Uncharacterized protein n=1 Tax=Pisum sativum TaxID=3888 RepID=A0A9D4VKD4_PEA|nr:hypothetical protein KIW84_071496 [Pisum sativum]